MLKYTTVDAIALRLAKRLQVGGVPSSFGKDVVDTALIGLVGPQVEARIEGELAPMYAVPLSLTDATTQAIVASMVEKAILAEILPVHVIPETGVEGGLRKVMATESTREMANVKAGNVRLKGEKTPAAGAIGVTPLTNTTHVRQRGVKNPGAAEKIQWG